MQSERGYFSEIFSAIQGEGVLVGTRQVFLRAAACNIRCDYCDQPESLAATPTCEVESRAGRRGFETRPNPLSVEDVLSAVDRLCAPSGLHGWASLTGGEPLVQAGFLSVLMPRLREAGLHTYLETNGVLPDALARVIGATDFVSMDWKVPSAGKTPPFWDRHAAFLRGFAHARGQVKIVVTADIVEDELVRSFREIARLRPELPVILQPLTPFGAATAVPSPEQVLRWQELAVEQLHDVRVIPQTHKTISQR